MVLSGADTDLRALVAETTNESAGMEPSSNKLIDSNALAIDVEDRHKPVVEHHMAAPQEADPAQSAAEAETPETKKKAPRSRKAKTEAKPSARKSRTKPGG